MHAHLTRILPAQKNQPRALIRWIFIVAPIFAGCGETPTPVRSTGSPNAKQELQRIFARYQECKAYSDRATIALRYQQGNHRTVDNARIETRFVRPNKIDMKIMRGVNSLELHSDSTSLWTQIIDPTTNNLDGQVIRMPAPATLTATQIYAATELVNPALPNEAMSALFGMPLNLEISQLGLLMNGEFFPQLAANGTVVRLDDETLNKVTCQRYQISLPSGSYIFWWSPQDEALRRIEYPPELLFGQLPESERPRECSFRLEMHDVRFGDSVETTFNRQPPADSEFVRFFVLPPPSNFQATYSAIRSPISHSKRSRIGLLTMTRGRAKHSFFVGFRTTRLLERPYRGSNVRKMIWLASATNLHLLRSALTTLQPCRTNNYKRSPIN